MRHSFGGITRKKTPSFELSKSDLKNNHSADVVEMMDAFSDNSKLEKSVGALTIKSKSESD